MLSQSLTPTRVFYYFEQLSAIPRGSGNMNGAAQFCEDFAVAHNLKYIRDNSNNVIIFKNGSKGYENSEPVILQGHLDMVCQKTPDSTVDFEKDGLELYIDGDFVKARGTTLGADNGIAVAMVLAVLESDSISHPPIEAIFTTDEEIGMIGVGALDVSALHAKRLINLDSEEDGVVTVSCAGGSDFKVTAPVKTAAKHGTRVILEISGLLGGHSGVEINKNRVNANMIAGRVLNGLQTKCQYDIISINGGDKSNAIPNRCFMELCTDNPTGLCIAVQAISNEIKAEITDRENNFDISVTTCKTAEYPCLTTELRDKLIFTLLCVPNGVTEMSAEIDGLVQTSLNLGILSVKNGSLTLHFALRSNKMSALSFLEQRLCKFFDILNLPYQTFGHYPAWEYRENSPLRDVYCSQYEKAFGKKAEIAAIHAGLECGVFASKIKDLDCIAIGPALYDVHTVNEKLSVSSTENLYNILLKTLENLK